jgi:hypothetical protein
LKSDSSSSFCVESNRRKIENKPFNFQTS